MASKLDWRNTDATNQPEYAKEAFEYLSDAFDIYKKAWADRAPKGKRPVFSVRSNNKGELTIGVALADGTAQRNRESLSDWLDRNKFAS